MMRLERTVDVEQDFHLSETDWLDLATPHEPPAPSLSELQYALTLPRKYMWC